MNPVHSELQEIPLPVENLPISDRAVAFLAEGRRRMREIDCFDFVPSNYEMAWKTLAALPAGRFIEWGSGLGIAVGFAEMLGHSSMGIEIDQALADISRRFLLDHGLTANIATGSYYERNDPADYYYVYAWPSQLQRVQEHFLATAPNHALLLIWEGQDDLRIKIKKPDL